jgi:hypothetical protein
MADEQPKKEDLFAVYAVRKGEPTPLIQTHLPFGRLMDDIVMPFDSDEMIKAFRTAIKPRLKDYLPNKQTLLDAAVKVFAESIKSLSGA